MAYPSRAPPPVPRHYPRGVGQISPGYANEPLHLHTNQAHVRHLNNGPGVGLGPAPISPSNRSPRYKDSSDAHNR